MTITRRAAWRTRPPGAWPVIARKLPTILNAIIRGGQVWRSEVQAALI